MYKTKRPQQQLPAKQSKAKHSLQSLESEISEEPVPSIIGSERVVRLQVTSSTFSSDLQNRAIPALTKAALVFDVFGIENIKD